ncbi:hypothetical protein [Solimonas variicoloris]|uniref:hypothetical protein n=1 Tax=Solimonas variicoloris TaxID=254408 RepID=UPI000478148A|nr:hypothetical protein [Solimonas variicoloris]
MLKNLLVLLLALSLIGCTTMRAVDTAAPRAIQDNVDVGDIVRVALTSGPVYELTVKQVTPTFLVGVDRDGKSWKVTAAQIKDLSVKKTSGLKTTGLVFVLGILAAVGLAVFGAYTLTHSN